MRALPPSHEQPALATMLRQASAASPYYRDQPWAQRLRSGGAIRFGDDIGMTPKSAVREHTLRFHADTVPEFDGQVIDKYTSGSTGEPMHIKKTLCDFHVNERENTRLKEGWKSREHRRIVAIKSAGEQAPFGSVEESVEKGRMQWTLFGLDTVRGLALLRDSRADMLHAYPSIAHEVLKLAAETSDALELRLIATVGEVLAEDFKELAGERFNCRILDTYGTVETGIIAGRCAFCEDYHPADRHLIFEVLGDDGSPASPGEVGRVVVTPLYNAAMPLIRYDTGDFVELAKDNDCVRSPIAIRRIAGRERNLFTLPDGRKVTPMVPARIAVELGLRQFKLVQTTRSDVELRYVLREGGSPVAPETVQAIIDTYLSKGLRAHALEVAEIPRAPSGKYLMHESLV